ncbi:hypothetical protein KTQ42_20295 [Noviherbaspirillum sp. L7-7A]|uniref:hypothetical protein n=1 Tax=Noviherbaspirillum sp. L7-7A TaxID=2850560 RepID=UPI001C2C4768|nr:hypothetical protein [Noviherbaspirillum sp. L7-7A]MBV0881625.1 hypothetical protein [Noviherbaspirillum sp. L7-7A]
MMQSPKVYVGTDDNVVVWRLRKNKQLEYLAVVLDTQLLYVRKDGAPTLLTVSVDACPVRIVTELLGQDDPAQALKELIAGGSFDDVKDLVTDPFLTQWEKLVQPQGEAQLFSPPPATVTILEF